MFADLKFISSSLLLFVVTAKGLSPIVLDIADNSNKGVFF